MRNERQTCVVKVKEDDLRTWMCVGESNDIVLGNVQYQRKINEAWSIFTSKITVF